MECMEFQKFPPYLLFRKVSKFINALCLQKLQPQQKKSNECFFQSKSGKLKDANVTISTHQPHYLRC